MEISLLFLFPIHIMNMHAFFGGSMAKQIRILLTFLSFLVFLIGCQTTTLSTTTLTTSSSPNTTTTTTTTLPSSGTTQPTTTTTTTQTETNLVLVSFDSLGGHLGVVSYEVELGSYYPIPQIPVKQGYVFDQWVHEFEEVDLWNDRVSESITLTATYLLLDEIEPSTSVDEQISETFDQIPNTGSAYVPLQFTSANGLIWSGVGLRSDTALDGKAVMLGGLSDSSVLEVIVPNGLVSLSFQAKKAFTNTNERIIDLYLNDTFVQSFQVSPTEETVQTFSISNLDLEGPVEVSFRHNSSPTSRAQVLIDNIVFVSSVSSNVSIEEQALILDSELLWIKTDYESTSALDLPHIAPYGSSITWELVELNLEDQVSLSQNLITILDGESFQFTLKVILTNGTYTSEVLFTITAGEPEVMTIAEYLEAELYQRVKLHVMVTNQIYDLELDMQWIFIQDHSGATSFFIPIDWDLFSHETGSTITIRGIVDEMFLSRIEFDSSSELMDITPRLVEEQKDLIFIEDQLVQIEGLLGTLDLANGFFEVINPKGSILVHVPLYISSNMIIYYESLLSNAQFGQVLTVWGNAADFGDDFGLILRDLDGIYVMNTFNYPYVKTVIESQYLLTLPPQTMESIRLQTSQELPFEAVITWSSSHPSVLSSSGEYTSPSSDTVVTMTYTISFGLEYSFQGSYHITVKPQSTYVGYYASVAGLSGSSLKAELKRLVSNMTSIGYSSTSQHFINIDRDLNNPGKIILIYDRRSVSGVWDGASTWNKEHVWPQSKLGSASDSDIHNLRASTPSVNSARGNLAFVDGSGTYQKVGSGWYPGDQDRGDVARIIFYMNTRYNLEISSGVIGSLATFIKWHNLDPVDDFERGRNNGIYAVQRNRNPYIDHPEFVDSIYGTYTVSVEGSYSSILTLSYFVPSISNHQATSSIFIQ